MLNVATFYRFVELENYYDLQEPIKNFCVEQEIKGTILLAEEGINATIVGSNDAIKNFFSFMNSEPNLAQLEWKDSYVSYSPFSKMKVRLKREIVALGIPDLDMDKRGEYIPPEDWDDFINSDDVLLIDTRNVYEIKLGTFKNAIDPQTYNFRELPESIKQLDLDKKKKIAMYCTGGVRCEKSTAYMKAIGFEDVYHLEGGILNYFEKTHNKNKSWVGDCFVFDDRVAVSDVLAPSRDIKCVLCGDKASTDDLKSVPRGNVVCSDCSTNA